MSDLSFGRLFTNKDILLYKKHISFKYRNIKLDTLFFIYLIAKNKHQQRSSEVADVVK